MIEYKCSKCSYVKTENTEGKTYSIKELKDEKLKICPDCKIPLNKSLDGISFKIPVYDLSYAKSYKRFKNGLHYDTTQKDKDKTEELNREMRYNNTQAQD